MAWSTEWPEKRGWYWGYYAYQTKNKKDLNPKLGLIQVRGPLATKDYAYIANNTFIGKGEMAYAFFQEAILPKPPTKREIKELMEGI